MPEGTEQATATHYQAETKYEGTVVSGFLGRSKNTNEPIVTITVAGPHGEIDWEKVVTPDTANHILKTLNEIWGVTREQLAAKNFIIPFLAEQAKGKAISFVTEWTQSSETAPKVMMVKFLNSLRFRRPADDVTLNRFEGIFGGTQTTRPQKETPPSVPPAQQAQSAGDPWGLSDADVPPPSQKYRS